MYLIPITPEIRGLMDKAENQERVLAQLEAEHQMVQQALHDLPLGSPREHWQYLNREERELRDTLYHAKKVLIGYRIDLNDAIALELLEFRNMFKDDPEADYLATETINQALQLNLILQKESITLTGKHYG